MRITIYARVSSNSSDQANSFESQQSYFLNKISQTGHELYRIYADKGLTGTKLDNRPQFLQMLEDAGLQPEIKVRDGGNKTLKQDRQIVFYKTDRKPLFTDIWCKNTSRFCRNILGYEIIKLLRDKGVNVYFLEENINTIDATKDTMLQIMQIFDQSDSAEKSRKVMTGLEESARKNVIHNNKRIYGFHYSIDNNSLTAIPEEAEVIRTIYKLFLNGEGIRKISNYLDEKGIHTREDKPFAKSTINRILKNEKYAGLNPQLKWTTGRVYTNKISPKVVDTYNVLQNDRIDAIVSDIDFYKVQDIFKSRLHVYNDKQIGKHAAYSRFGGHLFCAKCGAPYTHNVDKGRGYYNCSRKKTKGLKYCDNINVSERELEQFFHEEFLYAKESMHDVKDMCLKRLYYRAWGILDEIEHGNNEKIKELKLKINAINKEIDKLLDLYTDLQDVERIKQRINEKNNELELAKKELKESLNPIEKNNNRLYRIGQLISKVNDQREDFENEDEFLSYINIIVNNDTDDKFIIKNKLEDEIDNTSMEGINDEDTYINEEAFYMPVINDDMTLTDGHTLQEAIDRFNMYMDTLETKSK